MKKRVSSLKLSLYSLVQRERLQTSALRIAEVIGKCREGLRSLEAIIFG